MVIVASMLAACSSPRSPDAASVQWSDSAAQQARAEVVRTMNAFASMNVNTFKAGLDEGVVAFEMDGEGKPVRLGSRGAAVQYANTMFSQLRSASARIKLDIHSTNCRATAALAYCTVDFDAKVTMPDGSTMSQPTWNTVVLRKGEDGWKWIHWHSSLSVAPPQAAH
jgi:ketosteroid isomerase-like protein